MTPALIALDWGTSSLRAWLVGADGTSIDHVAGPLGILNVPNGDFAAAFSATVGAWRAASPGLPAIASGMIGSRQGWREAPYVECPATLAAIAGGLAQVETGDGGRMAIVPGLTCVSDGVPDVMRGEETQIAGALAAAPGSRIIVLPGTHSKWAAVADDGRVTGFTSFMTGEVFAVLCRHSILGRLMAGEAIDPGGFERGVAAAARAGTPGALLHRIFAARTLGLFEREQPEALRGYLSGLLIGAEVVEGLSWRQAVAGDAVPLIVGDPSLAALYERALRQLGAGARIGPADAALAGLRQIARSAGLLR